MLPGQKSGRELTFCLRRRARASGWIGLVVWFLV